MTHFIAIIEDAGPDRAIGVWFPDLPGCFSAGDSIDEALVNAPEAVRLYADALEAHGGRLPRARSVAELKADEMLGPDLRDHLLALVELPGGVASAAE